MIRNAVPQTVLVAMDGLVFGSVIAEHALDILHAADKPDVEHEDRHAQKAVHNIPEQRVGVVFAHDKVRDRGRRHDEKHHAQHQTKHQGNDHLFVAELHFLVEETLLFGFGSSRDVFDGGHGRNPGCFGFGAIRDRKPIGSRSNVCAWFGIRATACKLRVDLVRHVRPRDRLHRAARFLFDDLERSLGAQAVYHDLRAPKVVFP